MRAFFETSDKHAKPHLKPLRVAMRVDATWQAAREQASDLPGWTVIAADEATRRIVCSRRKRFLSGESTITISCEGPSDLPSTTVHVRSETTGGLAPRDKANVLEFLVPFARRVS